MAQNQERSLETISTIMRAVMKLSMLKGIDHVTVRDICAEAGISVGAFYHHFSSRQELLQRSFEAFDHSLSRHMEQRHLNKTPQQALTDLLLFQVRFMSQEGGGLLAHYYRTLLNEPSAEAVSFDRSYYRAVLDCIQRLADAGQLCPDCHPRDLANLCIIFVRGHLIDWCLHNQTYDVVTQVRSVLPIFLRGFIINTG
jgi:AcrR family transcriptional regulator